MNGYEIFYYACLLLVIKSITIGSEFNFGRWIKYRNEYTKWYFNRESWLDYKQRMEIK